jgi:hypothetical protein
MGPRIRLLGRHPDAATMWPAMREEYANASPMVGRACLYCTVTETIQSRHNDMWRRCSASAISQDTNYAALRLRSHRSADVRARPVTLSIDSSHRRADVSANIITASADQTSRLAVVRVVAQIEPSQGSSYSPHNMHALTAHHYDQSTGNPYPANYPHTTPHDREMFKKKKKKELSDWQSPL